MILYWLAGIFAGIGLGVPLGFFAGAAAQSRFHAQTRAVEVQKELIAKTLSDEDRYEDVDDEASAIGLGHPSGAVPPMHGQSRPGKKHRIMDLVRKMTAANRG